MRIIFPLLLVISITTAACWNRTNDIHFNRIVINYVHKDITAFFDVSCAGFELQFGTTHKKIDITDPTYIQRVQRCLQKEQYRTEKNIDVRVKIYLYNNDSVVATYCMDRGGNLVVNDSEYVSNRCFVELINEKVDKAPWP
jgi:hypothetical protein